MFADLAICPVDGRDGKTSSRHVDATAVSAAPFWNGVGLVIHNVPVFNCLKPVESRRLNSLFEPSTYQLWMLRQVLEFQFCTGTLESLQVRLIH